MKAVKTWQMHDCKLCNLFIQGIGFVYFFPALNNRNMYVVYLFEPCTPPLNIYITPTSMWYHLYCRIQQFVYYAFLFNNVSLTDLFPTPHTFFTRLIQFIFTFSLSILGYFPFIFLISFFQFQSFSSFLFTFVF